MTPEPRPQHDREGYARDRRADKRTETAALTKGERREPINQPDRPKQTEHANSTDAN